MVYLREQIPSRRRRYGPEVIEEIALDVIAAEYRHTTVRGVSRADAPNPQLHSHVVLSGALRSDGRFVAIASRPIMRAAREFGADYRSATSTSSRSTACRRCLPKRSPSEAAK
jgi:TrwC relaxase